MDLDKWKSLCCLTSLTRFQKTTESTWRTRDTHWGKVSHLQFMAIISVLKAVNLIKHDLLYSTVMPLWGPFRSEYWARSYSYIYFGRDQCVFLEHLKLYNKLYKWFSFILTMWMNMLHNVLSNAWLSLVRVCLRGLFIIDDKGILRQITMNDLPVGRSVDETLRLVQAFQYTDKHGEGMRSSLKTNSLLKYRFFICKLIYNLTYQRHFFDTFSSCL